MFTIEKIGENTTKSEFQSTPKNILADILFNSPVLSKDFAELKRLYSNKGEFPEAEKAIFQHYFLKNDLQAAPITGFCYEFGIGVEQSKEMAFAYFKTAADVHKYAPAQFYIGLCYQDQIGVVRDKQKAVKYFGLAAEQKYAPACNALGVCHRDAIGTKCNDKEAVKYFTLAAEQEDVEGQYNLGLCYLKGKGTPQDKTKAFKCFGRAVAKEGHELAGKELNLLIKFNTPAKINAKGKEGKIESTSPLLHSSIAVGLRASKNYSSFNGNGKERESLIRSLKIT